MESIDTQRIEDIVRQVLAQQGFPAMGQAQASDLAELSTELHNAVHHEMPELDPHITIHIAGVTTVNGRREVEVSLARNLDSFSIAL